MSRWRQKYHVPFVVTGFEPIDILQGIYMTVKQLEEGRAEVENQYARCVRREGNLPAQKLVSDMFTIVPRKWRGIGQIPQSGLGLRDEYVEFDAEKRFGLDRLRCRRKFGLYQWTGVAGNEEAVSNALPSGRYVHRNTR